MGQTRLQLRNEVRRNLGHPFVKVELCDQHIDDAINKARDMWIKWAVGNATQECWMTLLLKNGQWIYDLPMGVTEVISYKDHAGHAGGSNHTYSRGGPQQLFSLDNAMYMQGFMNANVGGMGVQGFNLVGYEITRQYMGMLEKYQYNEYDWTYHKHSNQLVLKPYPPCDDTKDITLTTDSNGDYRIYDNISCSAASAELSGETTFKSPGFVLLRTYMIEGASLPTYVPPTSGDIQNTIFDIADNYAEWIFSEVWIKEYVTALCMITLGRIRRKFANFSSLGNQGISMDGSDLISEGTTEKDRLELELDEKHAYDGFGITIG